MERRAFASSATFGRLDDTALGDSQDRGWPPGLERLLERKHGSTAACTAEYG